MCILSLVINSEQCRFRMCLRQKLLSMLIILDKVTVTDHVTVSTPYRNVRKMHVLHLACIIPD